MSSNPEQEMEMEVGTAVDEGGNEGSLETWTSQQDQMDGEEEGNGGGGEQPESPADTPKTEEGESSKSPSPSPSPPCNDEPSEPGTAQSSKASSPQNVPRLYCYSREQLMELKDAPLSVTWPACLDPSFNKSPGRWDPERWIRAVHDERRPSSTASTGSTAGNSNRPDRPPDLELKRSRDPRERVKQQEEQDGLVLSPQRRSFSTGCHGLQQGSSVSNRPDSPVERSHPQRETHREIPARRIGSGRISRRDDIDVPVAGERREIGRRGEREIERDRETEQRRDPRDWRSKADQRYEREERFDNRRRFFEEEEGEPKRPNHRDRERRYQDRKRMSRNEEEEQPEWFTGGPTSQNEFIELVGFDDIPEEGSSSSKPQSKRERRRSKKDRDGGSRKGSRSNTPVIIEESVDRKSPKEDQKDHQNVNDERRQLQPQWTKPMVVEPTNDQEMPDFNIDEFLEDIIGFQGGQEEGAVDNSGSMGMCGSSRLKQFFSKRESPILGSAADSRRSSVDLPPHINNLLNVMDGKGQSLEEVEAGIRGMHQPSVNQLSQMNRNHSHGQMTAFNDFLSQVNNQCSIKAEHKMQSKDNLFLKLMNGGMKDTNSGMMKSTGPSGPLENDLIAMLMKGNVGSPGHQQNHLSVPQQPRNMPPPAVPNLSVPPPNLVAPSQPPPSMAQMNSQGPPGHDAVIKLLLQARQLYQQQQQQQQQQQKIRQIIEQERQKQKPIQQQQQQLDPIKQLMVGISHMNTCHSPQPQDPLLRDALMRPDVQKLLQRVATGQVTASQLVSSLNCVSLTPSQRDAIVTVLKFLNDQQQRSSLTPSPTPQAVVSGGLTIGGNASLSPRVASPNPDASNMLNPHLLQQQSRLSPLMFTGNSLGKNLSMNNVGGGPRRPPSHQELVAHAQSIMQKALLKQELEKAKEKYRKREAERARSPNPNLPVTVSSVGSAVHKDGSPSKTVGKSQSPLVFTPTSVMRKMTADKDRHDRSDKPGSPVVSNDLKDSERNREQLSIGQLHNSLHQQYQQQKQQQQVIGRGKPEKRDLRRGASPLPTGGALIPGKGPMMMGGGGGPGMMNMAPHNLGPPGQRHPSVSLQPPNLGIPRGSTQNLNTLRAIQAQAALGQQLMRSPAPPTSNLGPPHHRMPNTNPTGTLQQLLLNNNSPATSLHHHHKPDGGLQVPLMSVGGGSHRSSPVNLATFFGRDIIAQVQAGGLPVPELPGGKVMSLEEVERLQQTQVVPN
ncbi:eukaryotic translation initiation factor 4E transporter-like isoform X2 [Palaemon carinicauda]|uniref:eukaryotic translation initiation factor 4E transporter-like isoform X2 n=1 Tax=Palaemon carinicauda TaxID=392227 RepID=UPI0035B621F9